MFCMAETEMHRLRDLPGVQRVTDLTRNPRLFDSLNVNATMAEIENIVVSLFGVPSSWLEWIDESDDDPDEKSKWEMNFKVTTLPYADAEPFWSAIGWDVSDGKGNELLSAHWFMRPIIAAIRELEDGGTFTPDGSGHWPVIEGDGAEEEIRLAQISGRLEADVAAFFRRQGR